jgi:AraC-like DNA-binding protein
MKSISAASELPLSKSQAEQLIARLAHSRLYQDYERAFNETVQLPLSLHPVEIWDVAHRGKRCENAFCAMVTQSSRSCAACLELQCQITRENTAASVKNRTCFAGLVESAVPVRLGFRVIGYLQTGQALARPPGRAQFHRVARQLLEWGTDISLQQYEEAWFQSRVMPPASYRAMVRLLEIFAQHLGLLSNQIAVQETHAEPPIIRRAKEYIERRKTEALSLGEVARALNVSPFYFCKLFKKATGLNFTEYLSRVRIEKAKGLLLNPNLRVSEIAYEVGFQSLTHFNRSFVRMAGSSPTAYRAALGASLFKPV